MQKIIRINARARRSAFKHAVDKTHSKNKTADKEYWEYKHFAASDLGRRITAEKKARRQDWIAGPLAPDRDTGLDRGSLGSLSPQAMHVKSRPEASIKDKKQLKIGNRGNIIAGDRVVVMNGPHRGKISEVISADEDDGTVTIHGLNTADIKVPAASTPEMRARKISSTDVPFPVDDVRLVYRPEGALKDVMVRYIERGEQQEWWRREPYSQTPEYPRYVAGTENEIPWPEEVVPDQERHAADTPRMHVDQVTYVPEILTSPFDASLAEELVPRYKKTQLRHEDNYVRRKIIEDARSVWYDSRRLTTPTTQKLEQMAETRRQMEESTDKGKVWGEVQKAVHRAGARTPQS